MSFFDDAKIMEQLKKDFVDEITFMLESCEESYLKLEQPELRAEEIDKIFRLAHSIKGSGAALGFTDLATFAHLVEDCLSLLRDNISLIESDIISLLLKTSDALKEKIENIKTNDERPWIVDDLREELKVVIHHIEQETGVVKVKTPPTAEQEAALEAAAQAPYDPFANEAIPDPTPPVQEAAPVVEAPPVAEAQSEIPTETPEVQATLTQAAELPIAPEAAPVPEASMWKDLASDTQKSLPPKPASKPAPAPVAAAAAPAQKPKDSHGAPSGGSSSVKIDTDRIDSILNIVGELVVIKSQLMNEAEKYMTDLNLNGIVSLMDKTIRDLQDQTLTMRMTPLKPLFTKLHKTVRDLSIKLGKPVEFKMAGDETELDRNMVELLGDPLLHILRNSIDHGIEPPETRQQKGKPEKGNIHIAATQTGGRVVIEITDDGGGLNRAKIIEKAKKNGIIPANQDPARMSDKEINAIIFAPGFSTAEQVTDLSGRGVGMDIVRSNIERLKGTIDITSEQNIGTTIAISLPLTTSITDGMLMELQDRYFIIPMNMIHELVNPQENSSIKLHVGQDVFNHRGKFLPMIDLRELLLNQRPGLLPTSPSGTKFANPEADVIVVVETGTRLLALRLEKIIGQVQVVLKPLGSTFDTTHGISGATILGNGKVALLLDPIGLSVYAIERANITHQTKSNQDAAAHEAGKSAA